MSRPATGVDTSKLKRLVTFKPMSDQTYYKYKKRILEAYEEIAAAEALGDEELKTEWVSAILALTERLEAAQRPIPTEAELEKKSRRPLLNNYSPSTERQRLERVKETDEALDKALALMKVDDAEGARKVLLDQIKAPGESTASTLEVETDSKDIV